MSPGSGHGQEPPVEPFAPEDAASAPSTDGREEAPPDEVFYCDLCGSVMLNLHCKLTCERCGYKRDCSDP